MPPKARITKEMIIDAGFKIVREFGMENVNTRTIAQKLGCSTQPVLYHFSKIEEIKSAIYAKLDLLHTDYLMTVRYPERDFMLNIGLNYIRFAVDEPHLFQFLFQSGFAIENNLLDMINSDELKPIICAMQGAMDLNEEDTKTVFMILALFSHGYASMIANNSLEYDENIVASHLEKAYMGAIMSVGKD